MAISTRQLIRNIPYEPDTKNARYVSVFSTRNLGPSNYLFTTVTKIPGDFTRKHKIWIRDQEGVDVMSSKNVWVSCDCERFCFMWEYALFKKGASAIRYSNGEAPTTTNGALKPAGCKHIYRCLNHLSRQKKARMVSKTATRR